MLGWSRCQLPLRICLFFTDGESSAGERPTCQHFSSAQLHWLSSPAKQSPSLEHTIPSARLSARRPCGLMGLQGSGSSKSHHEFPLSQREKEHEFGLIVPYSCWNIQRQHVQKEGTKPVNPLLQYTKSSYKYDLYISCSVFFLTPIFHLWKSAQRIWGC